MVDTLRFVGVLRQSFAGITGALSLMISGCWLGWTSPFLHKLQDNKVEFNYTKSETSLIVAIMDFGNFVSPIPSGYSMDIFGRKPTFVFCAIVFTMSWGLVIITNNSYALIIARFLAGWGKGMGFTVVPMYLAEIAQTRIRGALSTIFTILLFSGTLLSYILGPITTYEQLNYISASIPIIFLVLLFLVPESPYFLLMKGREDSAIRSFCWFRYYRISKEQNTPFGQANDAEFANIKAKVQKDMQLRSRWVDLVRTKGMRKATFIVDILSLIQRLGGISNMLAYASITLPKEGFLFGPEACMILFGLLLTVSNFACLPLIDRLGRKPLLIISNALIAAVHGIASVFYYLHYNEKMDTSTYNWVPYMCLFLFAFAYNLGIGIIPSTLLGEMFPSYLRGKSAAIATMAFSVGSFAMNKVYLYIKEYPGVYVMFVFFTFINIFSIAFTCCCVFETKNRTLEEIQDMLENERRPSRTQTN